MVKLFVISVFLLVFIHCGSTKASLPFVGKGVGIPNGSMSGVIARITAAETAQQRAIDSVLVKLRQSGHINQQNQGAARYCLEKWAKKQEPKPNYLADGKVEVVLEFDQKALEFFQECAKREDAF
jgi:hypothetical protein